MMHLELSDEDLDLIRRGLALVQFDELFDASAKRKARVLRERIVTEIFRADHRARNAP